MNFRKRVQRDADLEEELKAHFEMAKRDRIERGESPAQAARSTYREFGNSTLVKEVTREMWGWSSLERLQQDLRYTARLLRKSPGFAAVAILSIALGIGVNTAIFSLTDSVMLKTLPVADAKRLVIVGDPTRTGSLSQGGGRVDMFSYPFFEKFRNQQQVFTDVYASGRCEHLEVTLANGVRAGSDEERVRGRFVSGNFFTLLEVHPRFGREFAETQVRNPGSASVIVISDSFAQRTFGGDRAAVGQKVAINGSPFTVIGVMAPEFTGDIVGAPTDIWFPITMQKQANPGHDYLNDPSTSWLLLMGRLKPGLSLAQANAFVQVLAHRLLSDLYARKHSSDSVKALLKQKIDVSSGEKGFSRMRHDFATPLLILMGMVGLVLLICCANVSNLQLARAAARSREMSLRLAVGAGPARLVRQLLTESLVIAMSGAALGLLFAFWGSRALLRIVYETGPLPLVFHPDAALLLFTTGAALLSAVLFGLAPAVRVKRLDLIATLREKNAQPSTYSKLFGKALIVSQIVFSLVLLVGASLFIRTLKNLEKVDVGYARRGLVLAAIDFQTAGYTDKQINQLVLGLLERIGQLPEVESVSASENGLFSGTDSGSTAAVEGYVAHSFEDKLNHSDRVAPNYFQTIGTRIIAGRGIDARDSATSLRVAVINEKMARFYYGNQNPIGRHLFESDADDSHRVAITIVGEVRDVWQSELRQPAPRRFYTPLLQHRSDDPVGALNLAIRTRTGATVLASVRRAIKSFDPKLPILELKTAADLINDDLLQERLVAQLSGFFGLLAAVLAAIGLYGVMSYLTSGRTTEIGVRIALGAGRRKVMGMIMAETFQMLTVGLAIGFCASLALASLLSKALFAISPFDPVSMVSAALAIALAAGLATYLPARRASRIDPMISLRYQ